jgi:glutaredoxin-like YruB-family protein
MEFITVNSLNDIQTGNDKKFILFYKKGTTNSDCAYKSLSGVKTGRVYTVDVSLVRDVHPHFGITTAPSLAVVSDGKVENIVKGCHTTEFYDQLVNEKKIRYKTNNGEKPQKRVTVYSTPTCSFCNKLKAYFNKHGVRYTDINVAANQQAAMEMARKSGQRGVPQTEIDGQIIVGFDTRKLSKLLNIPTE